MELAILTGRNAANSAVNSSMFQHEAIDNNDRRSASCWRYVSRQEEQGRRESRWQTSLMALLRPVRSLLLRESQAVVIRGTVSVTAIFICSEGV